MDIYLIILVHEKKLGFISKVLFLICDKNNDKTVKKLVILLKISSTVRIINI